ncbi:MAG TPA: hypothetical protein VIN38_07175 [Thiobacillus sp.]
MTSAFTTLAAFDDRPFFDKALQHGVKQKLIPSDRLSSLQDEFTKGIIQIANFFGTAYLRPDLELALHRMVNLISLHLEDISDGDIQTAANLLSDKTLLSLSKAGSDMLKRLNAMPDSTLLMGIPVSAESQRAYLDEMTAADTISLAEYRTDWALRQHNQHVIEFAYWLAKIMGGSREDVDDPEALIRSAMLVIFVDHAVLKLPTRTAFVGLFKAARSPKCKLNEGRLNALLKEAPTEFQQLAQQAMKQFIEHDLPHIRKPANTADKLLYGQAGESYFIQESIDDDVREYDRMVAKEWDRVTHGESDDPAVLATVFLMLATGLPPKASMLLREARDIIRNYRAQGFDTQAVIRFIDEHAPESLHEELRKFWQEDLKRDAEDQISDTDPNWPDTHMERAIEYLRKTCAASWKGKK